MSMNINSLPEIAQFLEDHGYEPNLSEDSVRLNIGEFPTVITVNEERLTITTQLCILGQIPAMRQADFLLAAADLNTRILPFAIATVTLSDNDDLSDPDSFPVVLIDSMPIGDLHPDELQYALDSLLSALVQTRPVLEVAFSSNEDDSAEPQPLIRKSQISRSRLQPLADRTGLDFDDLLLLLVTSSILLDDGDFLPDEPLLADEPVIAEEQPVEETSLAEEPSDEEDPSEEQAAEETPTEGAVDEERPEPAPVTEEPASDPTPTFDDDSSRTGFDAGSGFDVGGDFGGSDSWD